MGLQEVHRATAGLSRRRQVPGRRPEHVRRLLELAEEFFPEGFDSAHTAEHMMPGSLSLVLGDALHNYRSALDHLVFQLAVLGRGEGDAEGTQFVIRRLRTS